MTAYDVRARAQAGRALAPKSAGGKGQTVTLSTSANGAYDPATSTTGAVSPTTQTGSGMELSYKATEIDGDRIQIGDKKLMLSPLNSDGQPITPPEIGHFVTYGGKAWRIQDRDIFSPAGTPVLITLQLRGA